MNYNFPDPGVRQINGRYYAFGTNGGKGNIQAAQSSDMVCDSFTGRLRNELRWHHTPTVHPRRCDCSIAMPWPGHLIITSPRPQARATATAQHTSQCPLARRRVP